MKYFYVRTCFLSVEFSLLFRLAWTLTYANSSNEANTKIKHTDIQTSMALTYDTFGNDSRAPALCVVMVRTVSTPSEIRAGIASISNQNDTHDNVTIRMLGTKICMM